jgi:hypothetical protein
MRPKKSSSREKVERLDAESTYLRLLCKNLKEQRMAAVVTPPLTLGEILDRTVQLYRRNFLLFLGIALGPAACFVLVSGGFSLYFTSHAAQLQGTPNLQLMLSFFGVLAGFLILGFPILLAISSLAFSALNYAAFQCNHQEPVTVRAAYRYAFRSFWRYLGILAQQMLFASVIPGAVFAGIVVIGSISATLLAATRGGQVLAVMIGLLFFILIVAFLVVMVIIWLRLSLAYPASLVENLKAWPSIQRSNHLSKGTRGRIFVMYLLVGILAIVAYYALVFPADLILELTVYKSSQLVVLMTKPPLVVQVINLFISFLQRAFVMPIYCIGLLLFYNDQRTRLEGYDIELLMTQAGWSNQPPPADPGFDPHPFIPASSTEEPEFSSPAWTPPHPAEPVPPEQAVAEVSEAEPPAAESPAEEPAASSTPQPPEASGA